MAGKRKSYSLHEARAAFSQLFEKAANGEPQRITRHGKDAILLVAEADWEARSTRLTLGSLLARHARSKPLEPGDFDRPFSQKRPLGTDFS